MRLFQVFVRRTVSCRLNKQTDGVKGWGARTTQKSSDPQNRLWQSGTHFTNCSNLSNYSLVTRYFVSERKHSSPQNKYAACASLLCITSSGKKIKRIKFLLRRQLKQKKKKGVSTWFETFALKTDVLIAGIKRGHSPQRPRTDEERNLAASVWKEDRDKRAKWLVQ